MPQRFSFAKFFSTHLARVIEHPSLIPMPERSLDTMPPVPASPAGEPLLVVNKQMAIACRVVKEEDGFFTLFAFDQITERPLNTHVGSLPDLDMALAEARRIVHLQPPSGTAGSHSAPIPRGFSQLTRNEHVSDIH